MISRSIYIKTTRKYLQPQKQSISAPTSIKGILGENTSKPKENNLTSNIVKGIGFSIENQSSL
jgi:hypothetical protein